MVDVLEVGNEPWGIVNSGTYRAIIEGAIEGLDEYYGSQNWPFRFVPGAFQAAEHKLPDNDPTPPVSWMKDSWRDYMGDRIPCDLKHRFDGVNVHPYSFDHNGFTLSAYPEKTGTPGVDDGSELQRIKNAVMWKEVNMPGTETYITEYGWDSRVVGETAQSRYLMRSTLMFARYGIHRAAFYEGLDSDDGVTTAPGKTGLFESCGIWETGPTDRNPLPNGQKEAYFALMKMRTILGDKIFLHSIVEQDRGAYAFLFGNANGVPTHVVTWLAKESDSPSQTESFTLPDGLSLQGNRSARWLDGDISNGGTGLGFDPPLVNGSGNSGTISLTVSTTPMIIPLNNAGQCFYDMNGNYNCGTSPCASDAIAPQFSNCPSNIIVTTSTNSSFVNWTAPTASDNCSSNPVVTSNYTPGSNFPVGTTIVTYTATDNMNNEATCSFTVTVNSQSTPCDTDFSAPVFSNCPTDITVTTTESSAAVNWTAPSVTDNCSSDPIVSANYSPGSIFAVGTTTIIYTAEDQVGNATSCIFDVTVTMDGPSDDPDTPDNPGDNPDDPDDNSDNPDDPDGPEDPGDGNDNDNNDNSDNDNPTEVALDCPVDIVLEASEDGTAMVSWIEPAAFTTCEPASANCSGESIAGFTYLGSFGGSEYYLSTSIEKWSKAYSEAEDMGGHLAIVNNAAENEFIRQQLQSNGVSTAFIGLSDEEQEETFKWVDNTTMGYENFGFFYNASTLDYVYMGSWTSGPWYLANDITYKNYVCEIPCSSGEPTGPVISRTDGGGVNGSYWSVGEYMVTYNMVDDCGNTAACSFSVTINEAETCEDGEDIAGFIYLGTYNNSNYYLSTSNNTWMNAMTDAEAMGGYLASINDADENTFLRDAISGQNVYTAFIGLSDYASEGQFQWLSGEELDYTNWGGAGGTGSADFVYLGAWTTGPWYIANQWTYKPFICEVPCAGNTPEVAPLVQSENLSTEAEGEAMIEKTEEIEKLDIDYTAVDLDTRIKPQFIFYPNPVESVFQVEMRDHLFNKITIYDVNGTRRYEQLIDGGTNSIRVDVSFLTDGMYFLTIEGADFNAIQQRFVKARE